MRLVFETALLLPWFLEKNLVPKSQKISCTGLLCCLLILWFYNNSIELFFFLSHPRRCCIIFKIRSPILLCSLINKHYFLYLFYTLVKLYYTKALSDQASLLALDWILFLWRPRILASFVVQQQPFILELVQDSSEQGKGAWSSSSLFS